MTQQHIIIKEKIHELSKKHKIKILFACESGSRAWGFPSPNSDYDVRFIYAHPKDWYLAINERADVLELPINADLDINGWDIRKALRLLAKHNAVLFEWLQSPVIYSENKNFTKGFRRIMPACFSPIAAMHHYLSMSKRYYEECTTGDNIKLKKYMYCLRTTLAANWIANKKTIPPIELNELLSQMPSKVLKGKIKELVKLKATQDESYLHSREHELEKFLKESIEHCEKIALKLPAARYDQEMLNSFFRKTIK